MQLKELAAKGEDSSVELNGYVFSLVGDFVVFYEKNVWSFKNPVGEEIPAKLHVYFLGGCGLLALAFNDKDELMIKDIASLQAVA